MDGTDDVTTQPVQMPIQQPPDQTAMIPQQPVPGNVPIPAAAMSQDTMGGGNAGFTATPSDIENHAAAVHHSRLANMLNAVGDILGGNKTLRMVKNPDGSVDLKQVDATPGEKWGRVAQAALRGAATGFAVGQGPGGPQRAAAASIQQGMAQPQADQDKTMALAEQANDQNQKRQLFNANMAHMNQTLVKGAFDMQQAKVQAGEHEEDRAMQIQKGMDQAGGKLATHIGADGDENKMMDDLANAYNGTPELQQAHHDGRTAVFRTTDPKTGLVNGADIYIVPEDYMDKRNDTPFERKRLVLDEKNPEKAPVWSVLGSFDKGSISNRDRMAMMQNDDIYNNQILTQYDTRTGAAAQAKNAELGARAQMEQAKASAAGVAAANKETFQPYEATMPDGTKKTVALGSKGTVKDYEGLGGGASLSKPNSGANTATLNMLENKYTSPARETEKSWQLADQTYQQYENLRKQGKDFPTGAESMLMMSRHLQSTFGQVKGTRVTKDMIAEHFGARSVTDDARAAISRMIDGANVTPNQWTAFHKLIGESRNASWQGVVDAYTARGQDPTPFLPPDLGGPQRKITVPPSPGAQASPGAGQGNPNPQLSPKINNPAWPVNSDGKGNYQQWNGTKYVAVQGP